VSHVNHAVSKTFGKIQLAGYQLGYAVEGFPLRTKIRKAVDEFVRYNGYCLFARMIVRPVKENYPAGDLFYYFPLFNRREESFFQIR